MTKPGARSGPVAAVESFEDSDTMVAEIADESRTVHDTCAHAPRGGKGAAAGLAGEPQP